MRGRHWSDRVVRKILKRLARRERNRKLDILRKTAKRVIELAQEYKAVIVIGGVARHKQRIVERQRWSALRHRLHQWSVSTLVKLLQDSPVHVELVDERGTSTVDPFSGRRIRVRLCILLFIRSSAHIRLATLARASSVIGGVPRDPGGAGLGL